MADSPDRDIYWVLGQEIKRTRRAASFSRPQFVALLQQSMPVNTYACYEQAIRPWPLHVLVDVCRALDLRVGDLIERALQSLVDSSGVEPVQPVLDGAEPDLRTVQESLDRIEAGLAVRYARLLRALRE